MQITYNDGRKESSRHKDLDELFERAREAAEDPQVSKIVIRPRIPKKRRPRVPRTKA